MDEDAQHEADPQDYLEALFDRIQGFTLSEEERERERTILLLLDGDEDEEAVNNWLLDDERCIVLDGRKLHFDRTMKHRKLPLVLHEARRILMHAMVHGKTVIFRLSNICFDLLSACDEKCPDLEPVKELFPPFGQISYFPQCWHEYCGREMRTEEWSRRMIHRSDFRKDEERPLCDRRFSVLFTSSTPPHLLDERLFRGGVGLPSRELFRVVRLLDMPPL